MSRYCTLRVIPWLPLSFTFWWYKPANLLPPVMCHWHPKRGLSKRELERKPFNNVLVHVQSCGDVALVRDGLSLEYIKTFSNVIVNL